jgi:hypothetical protein
MRKTGKRIRIFEIGNTITKNKGKNLMFNEKLKKEKLSEMRKKK